MRYILALFLYIVALCMLIISTSLGIAAHTDIAVGKAFMLFCAGVACAIAGRILAGKPNSY
jgi:hypothetical protein